MNEVLEKLLESAQTQNSEERTDSETHEAGYLKAKRFYPGNYIGQRHPLINRNLFRKLKIKYLI